MRMTFAELQEIARSRGLSVTKVRGSLYKYEIYKPEKFFTSPDGVTFVKKPRTNGIFARSMGEAEYEIENWGA